MSKIESAPQRLISRGEARRRAGNISRTTEHRLLKSDPDWPRPVQITPGLSGYSEHELGRFIRKRLDQRSGDGG